MSNDALVITTYQIVVDRLATYGLTLHIPIQCDYMYIKENDIGHVAKCKTIAEVEKFINGMEYEMEPV